MELISSLLVQFSEHSAKNKVLEKEVVNNNLTVYCLIHYHPELAMACGNDLNLDDYLKPMLNFYCYCSV